MFTIKGHHLDYWVNAVKYEQEVPSRLLDEKIRITDGYDWFCEEVCERVAVQILASWTEAANCIASPWIKHIQKKEFFR